MADIKKLENTNAEADQSVKDAVGSDTAMLDETSGLYTRVLNRPVVYDGKTYTELTFDFDSLTGGDSLDVEEELMSNGIFMGMKTFDGRYLIRMCARACTADVGYDIFRLMSVKDSNIIQNVARRFF